MTIRVKLYVGFEDYTNIKFIDFQPNRVVLTDINGQSLFIEAINIMHIWLDK